MEKINSKIDLEINNDVISNKSIQESICQHFIPFQRGLHAWESLNFPNSETCVEDSILGITEEIGELCHAFLKYKQQIRNNQNLKKTQADIADAIADLTIFLINLCSKLDLEFMRVLLTTLEKVTERNWTNNSIDHKSMVDEAPAMTVCNGGRCTLCDVKFNTFSERNKLQALRIDVVKSIPMGISTCREFICVRCRKKCKENKWLHYAEKNSFFALEVGKRTPTVSELVLQDIKRELLK